MPQYIFQHKCVVWPVWQFCSGKRHLGHFHRLFSILRLLPLEFFFSRFFSFFLLNLNILVVILITRFFFFILSIFDINQTAQSFHSQGLPPFEKWKHKCNFQPQFGLFFTPFNPLLLSPKKIRRSSGHDISACCLRWFGFWENRGGTRFYDLQFSFSFFSPSVVQPTHRKGDLNLIYSHEVFLTENGAERMRKIADSPTLEENWKIGQFSRADWWCFLGCSIRNPKLVKSWLVSWPWQRYATKVTWKQVLSYPA